MTLSILILAAGSSSRLGFPKQLVCFRGKTLLENTFLLAQKISSNVRIVLGANATQISEESNIPTQYILHNPHADEGMASSIRVGVQALADDSETILILLCDQPLVSENLLHKILQTYQQTRQPIVACRYAGRLGVPMLFSKQLYNDLLQLKGDTGAKAIIHQFMNQIAIVDFEEGAFDIDSPADIEQLKNYE